jgi:gentisate 1,2-dioxygenase
VAPFVNEAATLISAQEATRRVLVLENPTLRGKSRITQSLYAGLQLIMPGEIAPPHRHTSAAIRFILEGEGAYTQVEGEKTVMRPGDFVITPSDTAHDHGNESQQPMIWLDVLDLPTVNFFEAGFYHHIEAEKQNTRREHGDSLERDPHHGARVRYANPINGGWVMPTMGAHLALLPRGFKGKDYRSTDGTIFVCVDGEGSTRVDGQVLEWSPRDVFVIPPWKRYAHVAKEESVLFSISDRPMQEALAIWRDERTTDNR